ncbi:hypothetical protein Rmet_6496 [Cupriavidus metallidurans CH34]|uniref:Uncharacterized protein n=1 Tax=Cupriavidus metallidurans (strain ATCC 43123 / DSM 2839 / NBRC 102507 / CH34) TaxID=266264 RepID=D3DXT4_CUPMC|nr:hypothetical protein Rmet_6496 [Cupriavidus metallidurans CH34]
MHAQTLLRATGQPLLFYSSTETTPDIVVVQPERHSHDTGRHPSMVAAPAHQFYHPRIPHNRQARAPNFLSLD